MTRQIIFRGKDINGDWRYGDLVHNAHDGVKVVPVAIKERGDYPIEVLPDTVSQQWILNGLKVFGNDLVNGYHFDYRSSYGGWSILKLNETDKGIEFQKFGWEGWEQSSYHYSKISLLGNVFDDFEELVKKPYEEAKRARDDM